MKLNVGYFEKCLLREVDFKNEAGTQEYINEIDRLINDMISLKNSLRSGKKRHFNRKESSKIQGAVEALRFLKRKAQRDLDRQILSEGGKKISHLPKSQRASLSPEVVTQAVTLYKSLMEDFNRFLKRKGKSPVSPDKPVGSTYYYQDDLMDDTDVVYGDIDYLVVLPPPEDSSSLGKTRRDHAAIKRDYESEFLQFLKSSAPDYVDVELTGETSPTMVVVEIQDGRKIQIDLIATIPRYRDWMLTRWVPERGVKGYVGGNLYKAIGDVLGLSISDQGVLARLKDGKRVSSKTRGKDVEFVQVSSNPRTFFKDIVLYLAGENASIAEDLNSFPGMDPENILIVDIAKGVKRVAENLENNGSLPEGVGTSGEMLRVVLSKFSEALSASVAKKAKPNSEGGKITDEKLNALVKMNAEQYNNVENEFFNL